MRREGEERSEEGRGGEGRGGEGEMMNDIDRSRSGCT